MIKCLSIIFSVLFFSINIFSQNKTIDSLFRELGKAKADTIRINLLNDIGDKYCNFNSDSALLTYHKALSISKKINNSKKMSDCFINIGISHMEQGKFDSALYYYNSAFDVYSKLKDQIGIALYYHNLGYLNNLQGNFKISNEYYFKSLKIKEAIGDKKGMAQTLLNIGKSYGEQENFVKSIEFFQKAADVLESINENKTIIKCYLNIGTNYYFTGDNKRALDFYLKALKICDLYGNKNDILICSISLGHIYKVLGNFEKAIFYSYQALNIAKVLTLKERLVDAYLGMSSLYTTLADSNYKDRNSNLNLALSYGLEGYNLSKELKLLYQENNAASTLIDAYRRMGNYKKALEYSDIFVKTNDSLYRKDMTTAVSDMEAKYQNEKKQKAIELLEKDKVISTEKAQKQKIIIIGILSGLGILIFMITFILRRLRITRRQKKIIEEKNKLLYELNEEISTQRDEIAAQRDLVMEQKNYIENQNHQITDSINYARYIQQAVLPTENHIKNILGDCFLFFKPKDIVSGDFYWITQIAEYQLIIVADCTGHGVPGAFMSMLGISLLNEIVRKKEFTSASQILDQLRILLIDALNQKGKLGTQKDGMDIVFCILNTTNRTLQYAGANNPLFIVKANNELQIIEADKQPIAFSATPIPFTNHIIELGKGDCLYFTTDGYKDQFGGPKGKKFMAKQFSHLIQSLGSNPIEKQKEIVETTLNNWQRQLEQVDDITILGLRIP